MRKAIAASLVLFVVAACSSSSGSKSTKSKRVKPEILIAQVGGVPLAARHTDGMLSVRYAVRVENLAVDPITLTRVSVQSVSRGAYEVEPSSKPFLVIIAPAKKEQVDMWVPARAGDTILGANGPVILRVTCDFESPTGKFQHTVVTHVNERTAITGAQ